MTLTVLKVPQGLRGQYRLAKVFTRAEGEAKPKRVEYSAGMYFEVAEKTITSVADWAAYQLRLQKAAYACVVRGKPVAGLNPAKAQRLLTNFPDVPRRWLLVDYDKPKLPRGEAGADAARQLLPPEFHHAPCWWQRTGSYGVDYEGRESPAWDSRIRLAFILDKALTAPQIKRWLKHSKCDLAIYTANQINYTAAPVFEDQAIDPVLAAGESRFGTLDLDDALLDEVPVPAEIANYIPISDSVSITRQDYLAPRKREELLDEIAACDAEEGERHGSVARWAFDAYGLGMDEREIVNEAAAALERLGRSIDAAKPEAERLVLGARRKSEDGTLTVSRHHVPAADFQPVDASNLPTPATLTPAQAQAQNAQLIQWWDRLKVSPSTGTFKSTLDNAVIVLANHSTFQKEGRPILAYDAYQDRAVWIAPPPWWSSRPEGSRPAMSPLGVLVEDSDHVAFAVWLGHLDPATGPEGTPLHIGVETAAHAIAHVARYTTVNPATAYFDKCADAWDKVPRLHRVLRDICHSTTDPKLLAQWFPKWMVQIVARTYKPGSKCDAVLLFVGGQGARKSTFFRNICPYEPWFLDDLPSVQDKDAQQILRGKMIVEMSEMFAAKKDVDKLKGFIAKQSDTYRKSYGREDAYRPRTCVFCASSNDLECITDTGGRRWWPVACPTEDEVQGGKRIDLPQLIALREQLWGEAVHLYRKGEEWWLDVATERATRAVALQHSAGMEMSPVIQRWLNTPPENGGPHNPDLVSAIEIWTGPIGKLASNWGTWSGGEVSRLMKGVQGWSRRKVTHPTTIGSITANFYIRDGSKMALDVRARNEYLLAHSRTQADPLLSTAASSGKPAA